MNLPAILPFFKMQGSGNDFVLLDNRELGIPQEAMADLARRICPRRFGVGADGCIFLENAPRESGAAYRWHFFNADGSRAEMCGNASRCAAKLAVEIGLAGPEHVLLTDAGPIRARLLADGRVRVQLTRPGGLERDIRLDLPGSPQGLTVHFVNTGVPHAVTLREDLAALDVQALGSAVRHHRRFAPDGTNVNFVRVQGRDRLALRTFERGVEGETLACGTGAAASAIVCHGLGLVGPNVILTTQGGEELGVDLEGESVFLTGMAVKVYFGNAPLDSLPCSA